MSTILLDALETAQNEPLDNQVRNSAGGYSYSVDKWSHLRRFLILGSEGGTYYINQRDLTKQGYKTIEACLKSDGVRLIDTIVEVSNNGLAPKNDYALFALAVAISDGDESIRKYALANLDKVARIGTHLFQLAEYLRSMGSLSGRAKRRAFAKWYTDKDIDKIAYQVIKYRNRHNWTHRDILRVSHPGSISAVSPEHASLFEWIANGYDSVPDDATDIVQGFVLAQNAKTANSAAKIVREYGLPREAIPTEYLTAPCIWEALLDVGMPITAMMRNLANMTRLGVLPSQSERTKMVVDYLTNDDVIARSRIHPFNILVALKTYQSGRGFKGNSSWIPVKSIVNALDEAFYKSFGNVTPTGKRLQLAIDISASMSWSTIHGTNITPREAAAAMALITEKTEQDCDITVFSSDSEGFHSGITQVDISSRQRLDNVLAKFEKYMMGGTDCSLPITWADKNNIEYDGIIIYTDSETWAGSIHPSKALKKYRKKMSIDSKMVVVGMTSNGFTIADPNDSGMLDVVGFDTATPNIISNFVSGLI